VDDALAALLGDLALVPGLMGARSSSTRDRTVAHARHQPELPFLARGVQCMAMEER
jgi:hypothetical protein